MGKKSTYKNFILGLACTIGITSFTLYNSCNLSSVYAKENITKSSESKELINAKSKISHLTKSLKTNYLGIKNQGTWQLYIKQSRDLISKILQHENTQKQELIIEVDKDEALVNALARINQVEKSIQPKEEGGYGNYLGIKNAETWNGYLKLAEDDLGKVDKIVFQKQYDELVLRMNKVNKVVKKIENDFLVIYDNAVRLFEHAKQSKDKEVAERALREAERAGSCERTDKLKEDIQEYMSTLSDTDKVDLSDNPNHKLNLEKAFKDLKISIRGKIYSMEASELDSKSYKINLYSNNDSKTLNIDKKQTDRMIVYGEQDRTRRAAGSYYPLLTAVSASVYRDDIMQKENVDLSLRSENIEVTLNDSRKVAYATCKSQGHETLNYVIKYSDTDNTLHMSDN